MKKIFSFLVLSAAVAGCSTAMYDRQSQFVFFNTPNVENAECYVHTGTRNYTIFPPERALIDRSDKNMTIRCLHGRYSTVEVTVSPKTVEAPRFTLDHLSQYMPVISDKKMTKEVFEYPQVVTIDFGIRQQSNVNQKIEERYIRFYEDDTVPLSLTAEQSDSRTMVQDTVLPAGDLDGKYVY